MHFHENEANQISKLTEARPELQSDKVRRNLLESRYTTLTYKLINLTSNMQLDSSLQILTVMGELQFHQPEHFALENSEAEVVLLSV